MNARPPQLAHREDFTCGVATLRPSTRTIEGPGGSVVAEPRVMQVLLAFIDAQGAVLTREDLVRTCWNGAVVGDDAVNRAVAEIRRIARATGAGFNVETIPRVGYRLTVQQPTPAAAGPPQKPDRRWLIAGMGAGVLAASAAGFGFLSRRGDPRFDARMAEGHQALRLANPGAERAAVGAFEQAVQLEPDSAAAWGMLALSQRLVADVSAPADAARFIPLAEQSMRRALQMQPEEPNALLVRMLLQRPVLPWLEMESELRRVLALDPSNPHVLDVLVALLQAAGYTQDSWQFNEQAIGADTLRPTPQLRRALKLWILGKDDEADQHSAYVMQNWPLANNARNARLMICAFTGRFAAARQLLDDPVTAKGMLSARGIQLWKTGLAALESRTAANIQAARETCLSTAPAGPGLSVHAVLLLSALGEVDAAYQIVEGLMLHRGMLVTRPAEQSVTEYESDLSWRATQWLFTPAARPLRQDARFAALCEVIGLRRYWDGRGKLPDEQASPA